MNAICVALAALRLPSIVRCVFESSAQLAIRGPIRHGQCPWILARAVDPRADDLDKIAAYNEFLRLPEGLLSGMGKKIRAACPTTEEFFEDSMQEAMLVPKYCSFDCSTIIMDALRRDCE